MGFEEETSEGEQEENLVDKISEQKMKTVILILLSFQLWLEIKGYYQKEGKEVFDPLEKFECQVTKIIGRNLLVDWEGFTNAKFDDEYSLVLSVTKIVKGTHEEDRILSTSCETFMIKGLYSKGSSSYCKSSGSYLVSESDWKLWGNDIPKDVVIDDGELISESAIKEDFEGIKDELPEFEILHLKARIQVMSSTCEDTKKIHYENIHEKQQRKPLLVGLRNGSEVVEGQRLKLTCSVMRKPWVYSISWWVGGKEYLDVAPLQEAGQLISDWEYIPQLGDQRVECSGEGLQSQGSVVEFSVKSSKVTPVQLEKEEQSMLEKTILWIPFDVNKEKDIVEEDYEEEMNFRNPRDIYFFMADVEEFVPSKKSTNKEKVRLHRVMQTANTRNNKQLKRKKIVQHRQEKLRGSKLNTKTYSVDQQMARRPYNLFSSPSVSALKQDFHFVSSAGNYFKDQKSRTLFLCILFFINTCFPR